MLHRITPDLDNTQELATQIMALVMTEGNRVTFLVPPSQGVNIIARVRTKLSRKRRELAARGKRFKRFKLRATVHPHTEAGVRYDSLVFWVERSEFHQMTEELEDLLSNG
jgi:stalled ribosome rescue protein Dom34